MKIQDSRSNPFIFSITNCALTAPIVVREIHEVHVDVVDEYVQDVTCAGATTIETNRHGVEKNSPSARAVGIALEALSCCPLSDTVSYQHHG
jgi:hypothetical protein